MKTLHPALELFSKMFVAAAAEDSPVTPSSFVELGIFHAKLKAHRIERPENFVEFAAWWDSIGGPEHAHRLVMHHHKTRGTSPSAYERRAWSAHLMHKKLAV